MITCEVTESHGVTVNVPALRDCVELVADRPHQVGKGPVRPGGSAVVEVEAEAALPPHCPALMADWQHGISVSGSSRNIWFADLTMSLMLMMPPR